MILAIFQSSLAEQNLVDKYRGQLLAIEAELESLKEQSAANRDVFKVR